MASRIGPEFILPSAGVLAAALIAVLLIRPDGARAQSPAFEPQVEDIETLPPGEGREATFYNCTACHAFKLVAAQGMPRERWNDTIQWMIERHNMPPPTPQERTAMLDYLAKTFPPRPPRGGWRNPFAQ